MFAEQLGTEINNPDRYDYEAQYQWLTASDKAYLEFRAVQF